MTELEFEKVCRGPVDAVPDEYIWGTTDASLTPGSRVNANTRTETLNQGYAAFGAAIWIARCGSCAGAGTTRVQSGGSYYGAMDMGGNCYETSIPVHATTFSGLHGDGVLDSSGRWDVSGWTTAYIFRGGYFFSGLSSLRTSDRGANENGGPGGNETGMGRCVRTAP